MDTRQKSRQQPEIHNDETEQRQSHSPAGKHASKVMVMPREETADLDLILR